MDYFILAQDESIPYVVFLERDWIPEELKSIKIIERGIELKPGDIPNDKSYNFIVKSDKNNVYPDLMEYPLPLISSEIKAIFISHERNIQCNCAFLSDRQLKQQRGYWLLALERIDCASEKTEFYPNHFLKKLVLDRDKIGYRNVFRVQGIMEKKIIVSSDVAECILRRPMTGITLERINCIGEGEG